MDSQSAKESSLPESGGGSDKKLLGPQVLANLFAELQQRGSCNEALLHKAVQKILDGEKNLPKP